MLTQNSLYQLLLCRTLKTLYSMNNAIIVQEGTDVAAVYTGKILLSNVYTGRPADMTLTINQLNLKKP